MKENLTTKRFEWETRANLPNNRVENIESPSAPPIKIKAEQLPVNAITFYIVLCMTGILFPLILRIDFKIIRYLNHLIHLRLPPKIPCSNCIYFQNNPYLKCAVNPCKAFKDEAVNCSDYQEKK